MPEHAEFVHLFMTLTLDIHEGQISGFARLLYVIVEC